MDTTGFSQVGRYGTISLLKRNEEHTVVTSFGIDAEELTFGRETTCGVRLYYPDVALLHCKVIFEERKAFLVVLGESGVLVDGCKVFPHTSNNLSTIIPLANNSEFEIHSKRFRFSYPPKEIRANLFATPARPRNRALRLSMIHSAQVFSPHPSKDPRENLRILQSPLMNSFKSPVKAALQEEDEIILVQGSHPRVVQEEHDLVILEDVVLPPPSSSNLHANLEPPRTPQRRRSLGGNTLHRAVLIRSAQRAVLKAEKEREEEEEELEVLGAVVGADDRDEYEDNEREDIEMGSATEDNEANYLDETNEAGDGSTLVSFMTPRAKQEPLPLGNQATDVRPTVERFSLGGGEARRVLVHQPWRVNDLVIPPIAATSSSPNRSPEKVADLPAMTVRTPNHLQDAMASPSRTRTPMRTPARPTLTEEERKAIQERRRSALKESSSFFLGGAPGLTPVKPKSSSSSSSTSPMKGLIIHEEEGEMKDKSREEEEEDVRSLLDRMKETVDEMRRRRSVASRITTPHAEELSPRPLFAPVTPNLRRPLFQPELREVVDTIKDESNEEPFSLLRPGARDEVVSQLPPATLEVESSEEGSIPLPIVVTDGVDEEDSQEIQKQPTRAKARLLRAPKSIDVATGPSEPNEEEKAKALPVKRSQKAEPSVQDGEHVDSKGGGSLKAITTPAATLAKRGRQRKAKVVHETLDKEESTPPVPVIAKASTKKKKTTPSGSNDSKVRGTRKAVAAVQNTGNDDEEKDKENTVSGDVEDWEQTQAQGVTVKVRVSRSRGAASGERVEGTTGKMKTGSGRATRSASKAVKIEVVEEAVVEPVRMRTRAKTRTG